MTDEHLEAIRQRNERRKEIKGAAVGSSGGSTHIEPDERSANNSKVIYIQRVPKERVQYFQELYASNMDKDLGAETDVDLLLAEVKRLRGMLVQQAES